MAFGWQTERRSLNIRATLDYSTKIGRAVRAVRDSTISHLAGRIPLLFEQQFAVFVLSWGDEIAVRQARELLDDGG